MKNIGFIVEWETVIRAPASNPSSELPTGNPGWYAITPWEPTLSVGGMVVWKRKIRRNVTKQSMAIAQRYGGTWSPDPEGYDRVTSCSQPIITIERIGQSFEARCGNDHLVIRIEDTDDMIQDAINGLRDNLEEPVDADI